MKTNQASTLSSKLITRKSVIALAALVVAIVAMIFAIFMQTAKAETNEGGTVTWDMPTALSDKDATSTYELNPTFTDEGTPSVTMYYKGDRDSQIWNESLATDKNAGLTMDIPEPEGYSITSVTINYGYYNGDYTIVGTNDRTYSSYHDHSVTEAGSWTFSKEEITPFWTGDVVFWLDAKGTNVWKMIYSISVTYEKIPTYTVSFAVDSESTGSGFLSAETITDVPKGSIIYGYNNPCTVDSPTYVQLGSCLATAAEDSKFISWSPQYQIVESDITVYAKFAKTHTLTIHYKDADGNQLRNDEDKKVAEGETTILYAPSIESYQPEQPFYEYTMGSEDAEFTITYNEVRCDEKVDFNFQKIFVGRQRSSWIEDTRTWDPTYTSPGQPQVQINFTGDNSGYGRAKVSSDGELVLSDDMSTTMNYFTIPAFEDTEFYTFSIMAKRGPSLVAPSLTVTDSLTSPTHTASIQIPQSSSYTETQLELTAEDVSSFLGKTLYVGLANTNYDDIYIHDFGFTYKVLKTEISGTVLTNNEDPVEGAIVSFTYDTPGNAADVETETDENGKFSMKLEVGTSGTLTIDTTPAGYDTVITDHLEITEDLIYNKEFKVSSELEVPITPDEDSAYMHQGYHWALYKLVDGEWRFIEDAEITGNCTATIFTGSTFNYEGNATLVNIWKNPNVETDIQRQTWTPISAGEFYDFDSFSYILPGEDPVEMDVDVPLYIEDETFDGTAFTTAYIDNTPPVPPSPDVPGGEGEMIDTNAATGDATCAMFAILLVITGIAGLSIYRTRKQY